MWREEATGKDAVAGTAGTRNYKYDGMGVADYFFSFSGLPRRSGTVSLHPAAAGPLTGSTTDRTCRGPGSALKLR